MEEDIDINLPILVRHGLVMARKPMMLLPLGERFNRKLANAPIGALCQIGATGELARIVDKTIIPLKQGDSKDFSPISRTLSKAIYGKDIAIVFKYMLAGWERYIEENELLLLVVEKTGDGSDDGEGEREKPNWYEAAKKWLK